MCEIVIIAHEHGEYTCVEHIDSMDLIKNDISVFCIY